MDLPPRLTNQYDVNYFRTKLKNASVGEIGKELNEPEYALHPENVLWAAKDIAKDGEIEKAMQIAEFYINFKEKNTYADDLHKKIEQGEDPRIIATVRGVLPWLLQSIIVETIGTNSAGSFYTRALDITEQLAADPNLYVKQQATIPLELLVANIKATKHKEGDTEVEFNFSSKDKARTEKLAFLMLEKNQKQDRVLEYLVTVLSRMRYLDKERALYVLTTLLYEKDNLRPDYITENASALTIYYAEFRAHHYSDNFEDSDLKKLLADLINHAGSRLKSHILWLIWKNYKKGALEKFESYLPLFLNGPYGDEVRIQWDFLAEKVFQDNPERGLALLKDSIQYTQKAIKEGINFDRSWFNTAEIIKRLYVEFPEKFGELIPGLLILKENGVDLGDLRFLEGSKDKEVRKLLDR